MANAANYNSWKTNFIQMGFNVMDTVGRFSGGLPCLMLPHVVIKLLSGLRSLFIVLFLLIAYDVGFFESDWFITTNLLL